MEKLPMCRICLRENVPMYVVVNRNIHELYEKLTDIPFVTEDSRPILACSFCCYKLKQCCRFMRKCLEAEEVLADMTSEDHELYPILKNDHLGFYRGLVKTPTENINIVEVGLTDDVVVKEELPAVCEELDDIIEPKERHQSDDIKRENLDITYSDNDDIPFPKLQFENDSEEDVSLIQVKIEQLDSSQEESKMKRRVLESNRSSVAMKSILDTRRTILEDTTEQIQNNNSVEMNLRCNSDEVVWNSGLWENKDFANVKEKLFKCDLCHRCFSHVSNLKRHIRRIHNNEKPHKCGLCQSSFSHLCDLKRHTRTVHNNEKPHKCDLCQCSFSHLCYLKRHTRTVHNNEKPHKCDLCQSFFNHKGHLTRHILGHTGVKLYKCEICQRSFSQLSNLNRHIRTHNGDKPYKCDLCQHCYIDKRDLAKHIRTHIGEKPFKCEICQFSFNDKRDLTKHIRKHTAEKPLTCRLCQRGFRYPSDLKKHILTHTGEKPFQCDICLRSFNIKSNLRKHILAHSEGKPLQNVIYKM